MGIRRLFTQSLLALAMVGALAHNASALTQLALVSGGTSLVINDNVAPDANGAAGTIVYFNSNFNGWNIAVTTGQSFAPGLSPFGIDLAVLASCTSGNCLTQSLNIAFGSFLEFTAVTNQFTTAFSTTQTGTTASSSQTAVFNTSGSSPLPPALPAGAFGNIGPFVGAGAFGGSAIGGGPVTTTPYTLLLFQTYSAGGNIASFSADGNITGKVPEPASMLLFGLGLIGLGVLGRKRIG